MSRNILEESTAGKLAAIVIHTDELLDGHLDKLDALKELVRDQEVQRWIKAIGPLAPKKRDVPKKMIK